MNERVACLAVVDGTPLHSTTTILLYHENKTRHYCDLNSGNTRMASHQDALLGYPRGFEKAASERSLDLLVYVCGARGRTRGAWSDNFRGYAG